MEQVYDMRDTWPYTTAELYPQQILPVTSLSNGECYNNLPTPPHSPLQITDLTPMSNHRQYAMEPVQTMPTDLSMHEHLDPFNDVVFEHEKETWTSDLGLPDILSGPFVDYPIDFDPSMVGDPEDFVPSPPPSASPTAVYCAYAPDTMVQPTYGSSPRSIHSYGYDSDQEGALSDDTCGSRIIGQTMRRHEEYFTATNPFQLTVPACNRPTQKKQHNYRVKTDPISINDLDKTNGCKKVKRKSNPTSGIQSAGKISRKNSRGKGRREAMKGNHLWEFIRDLLKNKTTCPRIIRWENRQEGVFRFVNSEAVAGLWGSKKNNPNMNYEKLSRAMRYYYQRKILERVDGRRLVYKFGCNAEGWREAAAELTEDE